MDGGDEVPEIPGWLGSVYGSRFLRILHTSIYIHLLCVLTHHSVSTHIPLIALKLKSAIPEYASVDQEGSVLVSNEDLPKNEFSKITLQPDPYTAPPPSV